MYFWDMGWEKEMRSPLRKGTVPSLRGAGWLGEVVWGAGWFQFGCGTRGWGLVSGHRERGERRGITGGFVSY
jgi:hypothetical protein